MSMITIRNLQFQYDAAPEINALYGIDLEIRKGECIVLTGESGCGKTTLTRCLNGLIPNFFEGTLTGERTDCSCHSRNDSKHSYSDFCVCLSAFCGLAYGACFSCFGCFGKCYLL